MTEENVVENSAPSLQTAGWDCLGLSDPGGCCLECGNEEAQL